MSSSRESIAQAAEQFTLEGAEDVIRLEWETFSKGRIDRSTIEKLLEWNLALEKVRFREGLTVRNMELLEEAQNLDNQEGRRCARDWFKLQEDIFQDQLVKEEQITPQGKYNYTISSLWQRIHAVRQVLQVLP